MAGGERKHSVCRWAVARRFSNERGMRGPERENGEMKRKKENLRGKIERGSGSPDTFWVARILEFSS